jgi:hypothetical protein
LRPAVIEKVREARPEIYLQSYRENFISRAQTHLAE